MIRRLMFAFALALAAALPAHAQEDPLSRDDVEQIIREYLLENPEILAEAFDVLQEREQRAAFEAAQAAIREHAELLFDDPNSVVIGNPQGSVNLVEFYDYRCPYCREVHGDINRLIEENPDLRVVMKQFPVKDSPGEAPVSLIAARAAMAAEKQGRFKPFHDALFEAPRPLTEAGVYAIAKDAGLDVNRLKQDMQAADITQHIRDSLFLANQLGINGTPSFVVGDVLIPGLVSYDVLQEFVGYARTGALEQAGGNQP